LKLATTAIGVAASISFFNGVVADSCVLTPDTCWAGTSMGCMKPQKRRGQMTVFAQTSGWPAARRRSFSVGWSRHAGTAPHSKVAIVPSAAGIDARQSAGSTGTTDRGSAGSGSVFR